MQFWSLTAEETRYLSYGMVRDFQLSLVDLRQRNLIPDTILFLEHEPVITQGRGLQWTGVAQKSRHMPLPAFLPEGVSFCETERGGDLTYHGPGQLVIYPICKLDGQGAFPAHDISEFLRSLEGMLIDTLRDRGLHPVRRENASGVWLATTDGAPSRKVASLGIAVRKWVTFHGIAINCLNDLKPFQLISPCGFNPEVMTRLADWIPLSPNWRQELEREVATRLTDRLPDRLSHSKRTIEVKNFLVDSRQGRSKELEVLFESLGRPEKPLT